MAWDDAKRADSWEKILTRLLDFNSAAYEGTTLTVLDVFGPEEDESGNQVSFDVRPFEVAGVTLVALDGVLMLPDAELIFQTIEERLNS